MPRIAVSGHRDLPTGTVQLVDKALRAALSERPADVRGLTCLAAGADQIFARAVLDLGGDIEVVVPAEKYRDGLPAHPVVHGQIDGRLGSHAFLHRHSPLRGPTRMVAVIAE